MNCHEQFREIGKWKQQPYCAPSQSEKKTPSFPGMEIPMLRIRRSWDRLIFIMGIPILVRRHPILRRPLDYNNYLNNYCLQRLKSSSIGKCRRVHRFLFPSLPAVFHILVYIFKAELVYEICLESVAYGTCTNIFFSGKMWSKTSFDQHAANGAEERRYDW